MYPTTSFGVISESPLPAAWRDAGDVDDCGPCSDLMGVHSTAPWLVLRSIPNYRAAAGNPDDPAATDGLNIAQSAKALGALYPELAIEVHEYVVGGITGAEVARLIAQRGIAASVSVLAGKLPDHGTFLGQHRVAIAGRPGGLLVIGNPLKPAYSNWQPITPAALALAIDAYPKGVGGGVILFPSVDAAFTRHPLYVSPAAAQAIGHTLGFADGKAAALAAVQGI